MRKRNKSLERQVVTVLLGIALIGMPSPGGSTAAETVYCYNPGNGNVTPTRPDQCQFDVISRELAEQLGESTATASPGAIGGSADFDIGPRLRVRERGAIREPERERYTTLERERYTILEAPRPHGRSLLAAPGPLYRAGPIRAVPPPRARPDSRTKESAKETPAARTKEAPAPRAGARPAAATAAAPVPKAKPAAAVPESPLPKSKPAVKAPHPKPKPQ